MNKQYINSSNEPPRLGLAAIAAYIALAKVFDAPTWVYGVIGTVGVLFLISFIYRLATEDGVDVVSRKDLESKKRI